MYLLFTHHTCEPSFVGGAWSEYIFTNMYERNTSEASDIIVLPNMYIHILTYPLLFYLLVLYEGTSLSHSWLCLCYDNMITLVLYIFYLRCFNLIYPLNTPERVWGTPLSFWLCDCAWLVSHFCKLNKKWVPFSNKL